MDLPEISGLKPYFRDEIDNVAIYMYPHGIVCTMYRLGGN